MVKITALKEVVKALFKCVTTGYPQGPPTHIPPGMRGLPQFDEDKCIGCGACFASCPSKTITMANEGDTRRISIPYTRCIFCGRCEEVCPEEGIRLSDKFELATGDKEQALVSIEFRVQKCKRCGAPITTPQQLDRIKERILENIDPHVRDVVAQDLAKYMDLCVECRRRLSFELDIHPRKFYLRRWEK